MNPGMQSDIGCLECVCMSSCRASQVDKNIAWILGLDLLNSVLYFLMPCLPDCFRIGFWGMKKSGSFKLCIPSQGSFPQPLICLGELNHPSNHPLNAEACAACWFTLQEFYLPPTKKGPAAQIRQKPVESTFSQIVLPDKQVTKRKIIHQGVPNDSGAQLAQRGVPQVQPRHFGEHRDAPGEKSGAGVCV
jgi:hypothetical protein